MKKRIIVSAANDGYYSLLSDLISSIEDNKGAADVAIGVLDLGLTAEQRQMLSIRVQHIVTPNWDYPLAALNSAPRKFQAMTSRPHLPKHFPGYATIMWMDADTWIQRWSAVEYFFEKAETRGLAVCQELDRSYDNVYDLNDSRQLFSQSLKAFGNDVMQNVIWMPIVNSGVFAMRADSPYWSQWRNALGHALQRGHLEHLIEQTAFNVCIYRRLPFPYFMPARFNWVCSQSLPRFDERTLMYVEPGVPHDAISIVHLAGLQTRLGSSFIVVDVDGNRTKMNLLYSQWKQHREERHAGRAQGHAQTGELADQPGSASRI
jgi:hypothetical protein